MIYHQICVKGLCVCVYVCVIVYQGSVEYIYIYICRNFGSHVFARVTRKRPPVHRATDFAPRILVHVAPPAYLPMT